MKIFDMISMCVGNLVRRKLRTALTVLGVVLGTALLVTMLSISLGMNRQIDEMLEQMGDLTLIDVYSWNSSNQDLVLDDAMVSQFQGFTGVDVATPVYNPNFSARIYSGKKDRYQMDIYNITGMYSSAMSKMGYQLLEGEYPTGQAEGRGKPLLALSGEYTGYAFQDTKKKFDNRVWPEQDPVTGKIKQPFVDIMKDDMVLRTYDPGEGEDSTKADPKAITREIKVVGRVKEDYNKGYETSRGLFMDINDLRKLEEAYNKAYKIRANGESKGYDRVVVKTMSMDEVDAVEEQIKALGFETQSMETYRKPMQENVRKQQLFFGAIGGITLIVAAVGIMNTMYMSINERTREIGVMKVLGCRVSNIRTVFLMEAGTIGFAGGCIAVALSYGFSHVMNYVSAMSGAEQGQDMMYGMGGMMMGGGDAAAALTEMPLWLVGAAIAFATLIGLLSGFLPANRAMKISALEAIKQE